MAGDGEGLFDARDRFLDGEIVVDCGFNNGIVLSRMLRDLPGFKAYGFEVNEGCFGASAQRLKQENPRVLELEFSAVSDHDGSVSFYEMGIEDHIMPMQGTTIVEGLDPDRERGEATEVKTVDFSCWLQNMYVQHSNGAEPFIAVKMDIEGAEYDVLERMIETGAINMVDVLAIEYHARRFPEADRPGILERENAIRSRLSDASTCVQEWI